MKNKKITTLAAGVIAAVGLLLSCSLEPYGEGLGKNSKGGDASIIVPNVEGGNDYGGGGYCTKPSAPSGVSASAQSSSSIKISWYSVSGASYYNVYRATSSYGTYSYVGYVTGTSCTDTYLSSSTTYYYKITAENSCGESGYSSYTYATTSSSVNTSIPNAVQITLTSYKENGKHDVGLWGTEADPRISFIIKAYSSSGSLLSTNYSSTMLSLDDPSGGSWTGSKTESVSITAYATAYKVSVQCQVLDKDVTFDDDISPSQYWSYSPLSSLLNQSFSETAGTSYDDCIVKYSVKFIRL